MSRYSLYDDKEDLIYQSIDSSQFSNLPGVIEVFADPKEEFSSQTGVTPSKFITVDGIRYFVKYPTLRCYSNLYEVFVELFVSFLAKKCGIDCIDSKLLIDHKRKAIGVVSADFGEHITYSNFGGGITYGDASATPVTDIIERLKQRTENMEGVSLDVKQITELLNKRACFDYLTSQADRHSNNIAFIITGEGDKKELKLAPLYDNANAFLRKTGRFYKYSPNGSRVWGVEEQKLLNTEYLDMLNLFETLFSDENFNSLMQEFNAIYGVDKLYEEEAVYQMIVANIQGEVKKQIEFCKHREEKEEFIPIEAVYIVMQRHKAELDEDKNDLKWGLKINMNSYFSDENWEYSYKNFYTETVGWFRKWPWYEECLQVAKAIDKKELNNAKQQVNARKREFGRIILSTFANNTPVSFNDRDERNFILFDDRNFCERLEKDTRSRLNYLAVYRITNNYKYYVELRDWCNQMETSANPLTKQEQAEVKATKKILKKYIKRVNSYTNKKLSRADIEALQDAGVELKK